MIVTDSKETALDAKPAPPPYSSASAAPSTLNSAREQQQSNSRRPPDIPRSNFVRIEREDNTIKGTFVIDTSLEIPESLLRPHEAVETEDSDGAGPSDGANTERGERQNLRLFCRRDGINADIWLVNESEASEGEAKRAVLSVKSNQDPVRVKIHADCARQPFTLTATSERDVLDIMIPRSFVGPVTIHTRRGTLKAAYPLSDRLTVFSDFNNVQQCFIGDFRSAGYGGKEEWKGCSLILKNDSDPIRLSYIQEAAREEAVPRTSKGFWGWLTGA